MPNTINIVDAVMAITTGGYFSHTKAAKTISTSTYINPISSVKIHPVTALAVSFKTGN
jgi:hypothetical protein